MRTLADLQEMAAARGWVLNPNARAVDALLKSLNRIATETGNYYCPCKLERKPTMICPCADASAEIAATGHCHCLLFFSPRAG